MWRYCTLSLLMELLIFSSTACQTDSLLMSSTTGDLFRMDLRSLNAASAGRTALPLWDIAIDDNGTIWGITDEGILYQINQYSAQVSRAGDIGFSGLSSLVFDPARKTLWAASESGDLVRINPDSLESTLEMHLPGGGSAGDLAMGRNGELLLTTNDGFLVAVDVERKTTQIRGSLPNGELWAIDRVADGRLIAVDAAGTVYEIDESNASSRQLGTIRASFPFVDVGGGSW